MKKKFFIYGIIIFFFWLWKDYKKIDFSYINQSKVTYDYNNLNSNFLRKIHKLYNSKVENFLVKNFEEHKKYWEKENPYERDKLPEIKMIKSEKNFTLNKFPNEENFLNWPRSHGNHSSNRFSSLKLINNKNAHNLQIAWIYRSKDQKNDIQANPIVIGGIIYTPISGGFIAAIDGSTGEIKWKSKKFGTSVARRGLVFWKGNKSEKSRIIFSNREKLVSLDAQSGEFISTFGKNGQVRTGLNVLAPVIYKDYIVIATWDRAIEIYNLFTGKTEWKLKYKKKINKRFGGKKYNNLGANPWGGISADINRGILYVTTGNPHHYFDGTQRPGSNSNSNSIIAIDLNQKKILWSFQETTHDIWNSDLPAPPILTSLIIDNKFIDVVVTPTKRANTLIIDRVTGNPIFDFVLSKAPISKLKGEKTSEYQPDLKLPEPFGKNIFSLDDLWSYDQSKKSIHKDKYKSYNFGFYQAYELNKKNLQYNFNGGAEWMGASVDHDKQIMYVTSNNIPWETEVKKLETNHTYIPEYFSDYKRALDDLGYPVTKPPWGTLTALNLNSGKIIWQVPFGEYEFLKEKGITQTGTENFGGVTATSGNIAIATGTLDKKMYVFNSKNGSILYSKKLPFIGSAPPTTYIHNNKQYIIIHATGGSTLKKGYPDLVEFGNALVAFKLKD